MSVIHKSQLARQVVDIDLVVTATGHVSEHTKGTTPVDPACWYQVVLISTTLLGILLKVTTTVVYKSAGQVPAEDCRRTVST